MDNSRKSTSLIIWSMLWGWSFKVSDAIKPSRTALTIERKKIWKLDIIKIGEIKLIVKFSYKNKINIRMSIYLHSYHLKDNLRMQFNQIHFHWNDQK